MKHSYQSDWAAKYNDEPLSFAEVARANPLANWQSNAFPDSMAAYYLDSGLTVLCAAGPEEIASQLFRNAELLAQLAVREGRLTVGPASGGYPANLGVCLKTATYAGHLLGAVFDPASLIEPANRFLEYTSGEVTWDSVEEAYVLSAIRLLIIANEWDKASRLMPTPARFESHRREAAALSAVLDSRGIDTAGDALGDVFNTVRNPRFSPEYHCPRIAPFELALVLLRLMGSKIDFRAAVSMVAR